jgi:hypothetical protein
VTDTQLFAAWRCREKNLLNKSGETPNALFKHGGCLDLMLATETTADADRTTPVPGDQRLLITQVTSETRALLYRAKVPGTKEPVPFSSPWRSVSLDVVEDGSQQIRLASDNAGNFEISIPLRVLHWEPKPGTVYCADIGVLRANGQTTRRLLVKQGHHHRRRQAKRNCPGSGRGKSLLNGQRPILLTHSGAGWISAAGGFPASLRPLPANRLMTLTVIS